MLNFFLKGWLIGFSVAMPLGPIGIVCLQHTLLRGMLYGIVAGLGVAVADALYGILAGLSVTIISSFLITYQLWLQVAGVVFLWYFGVSFLREQPAKNDTEATKMSLKRVFLTTFALTFSNPMTVLCFVGIYAGLGVCSPEEGLMPVLITASGVLIGSTAWWLLLSGGVTILGRRFNRLPAHWLNRAAGMTILMFAFIASLTTLKQIATS